MQMTLSARLMIGRMRLEGTEMFSAKMPMGWGKVLTV
jgi:hypothetical protein